MFEQNQVDTYQFVRGNDLKHLETPFATIHLNTTAGNAHVVQRWKYEFTVAPGQPAWTDREQTDFHYALLSLIWKHWNSQRPVGSSSDPTTQRILNLLKKPDNVRFNVSGTHPFAKQFAHRGVDVDFDVIVNASKPHWRVTLRKIPATAQSEARVNWGTREIRLFSRDNIPAPAQQQGRNPASNNTFVTTPHEFGHTLIVDDEYTAFSRHRPDVKSIMNIGSEIRPRHLSFIAQQLSRMLSACRFTPVAV